MNFYSITSLVFLFAFYVVSLTDSYGFAFLLFTITFVTMLAAIYTELGKEKKTHLKVIK
ncbi:hypothetical protein [Bacillus kwashiorkori]|uniref:hypothetical protein n=1 Tax=Bacillus kwashiorkori TaxID=1522318 RepID=UPI001319E3C4|nr:hypothetical protein [Bacillus kwashiorkori]